MFINIGMNPYSWLHSQAIRSLGIDKAYELVTFFFKDRSLIFSINFRAMRRDAKTVAGWDFERIIPCHGVRFFVISKMLNNSKSFFSL
jgi:hypothetical protein